jgi:hypothetical protein
LGQAREALLFAQCPAAVAKVRQAIRSTEGALRTAKRRLQPSQVARSGAHLMAPCLLKADGKRRRSRKQNRSRAVSGSLCAACALAIIA